MAKVTESENMSDAVRAKRLYLKKQQKGCRRLPIWVHPSNWTILQAVRALGWESPIAGRVAANEWLALLKEPKPAPPPPADPNVEVLPPVRPLKSPKERAKMSLSTLREQAGEQTELSLG